MCITQIREDECQFTKCYRTKLNKVLLQMFVPNWVGVYGSQYTEASQRNRDVIDVHNRESYHYEMKITKSGLRALDQPTERCDSYTKDPNTSKCIARYIEDQIGCRMNIQGGGSATEMAPCKLISELEALKNITRKFEEATANTIFKLTGCQASCKRNEYGKIDSYFKTDEYCWTESCDLHLEFKITEGSYKEEEQYIIYDFNSFISGVGGILGLCNLLAMVLLGFGVLSLHNKIADLLGRFKPGKLPK